MRTVCPERMVSTGALSVGNQPHVTFSGREGRTWSAAVAGRCAARGTTTGGSSRMSAATHGVSDVVTGRATSSGDLCMAAEAYKACDHASRAGGCGGNERGFRDVGASGYFDARYAAMAIKSSSPSFAATGRINSLARV